MTFDRRSLLAGGAATLLLGASASAEDAAADMIARESAAAAEDGKRLMLVFEASWCVWCEQMDMLLEDEGARAILDRSFRIVHLRALERDEAERARQLPGADDVYLQYAGEGVGLPFTAVLDAEAQAVTTSLSAAINGVNFGFPVTDEELQGFEAMLAIAAPGMTAEDRAALRAVCVRIVDA